MHLPREVQAPVRVCLIGIRRVDLLTVSNFCALTFVAMAAHPTTRHFRLSRKIFLSGLNCAILSHLMACQRCERPGYARLCFACRLDDKVRVEASGIPDSRVSGMPCCCPHGCNRLAFGDDVLCRTCSENINCDLN